MRLDVTLGRGAAFCVAEGSARRSTTVRTSAEAFYSGIVPVHWEGSGLEWWSLEGGCAFPVADGAELVGGLRLEHLSLRLGDPVDPANGLIVEFRDQYGDSYSMDLQTKTWIPYIGIRLNGSAFKACLIISPLTWANVRIPARYLYNDELSSGAAFTIYEDARFSLNGGGVFLKGSIEYRAEIATGFDVSLWCGGSWFRINGKGTESYSSDLLVQTTGVASDVNDASESAAGSFSSVKLGGGLTAAAEF
ncbi:hypothetical protein ACFL2Q_19485 [Thermodesulfobacteriota bacterium]